MRLSRFPKGLVIFGAAGMGITRVVSQSDEIVNCCIPPYAFFDCTGGGHTVTPGKVFTCETTASLTGCMSCLGTVNNSKSVCTTCCTVLEDAECRTLDSDWEFYASTVFFVFLCCCFSVLCGLTEVRRKKKGISFAQAWSVPQAMPILRTWPGRSVSASDVVAAEGGANVGGHHQGQHWQPLSDEEDDLKQYPVAGLVDDSGMAFGFITTMPQSFLGTVAASLGRPGPTTMNPPPTPQEPELTVWISQERDHGVNRESSRSRPHSVTGTAVTTGADAQSARDRVGPEPEGGRAVVVGNEVQIGNGLTEPLVAGETGPGRGVEGERDAVSNSALRNGNAADVGIHGEA